MFFGSLWRAWRERLTRAGRYALLGAVTTGIAASFPEHMIGSYAFSFFTALFLTAAVMSHWRSPRVTVRRQAPDRVMAGSSTDVVFHITNDTSKPVYDVSAYEFRIPGAGVGFDDEPRYVDRLNPGETVKQTQRLVAEKRGHYSMPGPSALSAFPFGLTNALKFFPDRHNLVVYPAFKPLQRLDIDQRLIHQPGGVALASRVGEAMEFVGTREYRPGDRVRDLHPRSWARIGQPVVRQFDQEFFTRVALVVDTFAPKRLTFTRRLGTRLSPDAPQGVVVIGQDTQLLEANLSLAAAVADSLARQDFVVDLFAAGPKLYQFQSGRSLAYLENILDILAGIEPCRDDPMDTLTAAFCQQLAQTSTVVALLMSWDAPRSRFVRTVQEAGVPMRIVVVTDNHEQAEAAREAGAVALRVEDVQRGIEVL